MLPFIASEMKLVKSHFAIPFFSELLFIVLCACEKKKMKISSCDYEWCCIIFFSNYVSLFLRSGKQWNFFYFFSLLPSHHHHYQQQHSFNIIFLNVEKDERDLQCSTYFFMRLLNKVKMDYGMSFLSFWGLTFVCETLNLLSFSYTHTNAQQQQLKSSELWWSYEIVD